MSDAPPTKALCCDTASSFGQYSRYNKLLCRVGRHDARCMGAGQRPTVPARGSQRVRRRSQRHAADATSEKHQSGSLAPERHVAPRHPQQRGESAWGRHHLLVSHAQAAGSATRKAPRRAGTAQTHPYFHVILSMRDLVCSLWPFLKVWGSDPTRERGTCAPHWGVPLWGSTHPDDARLPGTLLLSRATRGHQGVQESAGCMGHGGLALQLSWGMALLTSLFLHMLL